MNVFSALRIVVFILASLGPTIMVHNIVDPRVTIVEPIITVVELILLVVELILLAVGPRM